MTDTHASRTTSARDVPPYDGADDGTDGRTNGRTCGGHDGGSGSGGSGSSGSGSSGSEARGVGSDGGGATPLLGGFLARAAVVTAALTAAGAVFGLLRDQTIASLFGADADTDAFLVAWTVPELAATLLIEDAMALILVPAFSLALSRRAHAAAGRDPVRDLVRRTLPRLLLGLTGAAALMLLAAPLLVRLLAPGLPDARTAVDCMRLTSLTVVTFGLAGYFSAALRAHRRFVAPASIYVAYNAAIIAVMFAGHTLWGVRSAATGVAVGGGLMVLVQLPSFVRELHSRRRRGSARTKHGDGETAGAAVNLAKVTAKAHPGPGGEDAPVVDTPPPASTPNPDPSPVSTPAASPDPVPAPARAPYGGRIALIGLGMLAPVLTFAVSRQAQVLFERYLASPLPAGAISHLNYAQKVAQMPMVLSLMVCTVTFPVVARAMADGDTQRARLRVERDLALVGIVVLLGAAYVMACAPQIVQLLFERGEFDARDTADTASVMRVYSCGLLGHSLVGALARPFFAGTRPTWFPAAAMAVGLLVTVAGGALAVQRWGVHGIAAANAAGILVTALLLLHGLGARVVAIDVRRVSAGLARLLLAAAVAAAAGWGAVRLTDGPLAGAGAGGVAVLVVFASVAHLVRAPEVPQLFATVKRRFAHVR